VINEKERVNLKDKEEDVKEVDLKFQVENKEKLTFNKKNLLNKENKFLLETYIIT